MANTAKLKDRARAAENRGQWTDAVVLYRQLLEESDAEDADVGLWNRVGDLHLKVGETDRAVDAYERAVSAYAEAGLFNNAIALCRKILRLVPGRISVYLRLGQISAGAGFLADARQNFLEYADRMRRAGKQDEAFEALKEFAELSPDDTEVRRLLADQLLAHGRREEAVEQLRILLGGHEQRGREAEAAAVREQILAIDPAADATPLVRSRRDQEDEFSAALHDGSVAEPPRPEPAPDAGVSLGSSVEEEAGEPGGPGDVPPLAGLEATALDGFEPLAGLEPTSLGGEADEEPLPLLESPLPEWAPEEEEEEEEEDEEGGDDPLPLLSFDETDEREAPSGPEADPLERRLAHAAAVPEDSAAREELVRELRARGRGADVVEVLETAHRALAARGMYFEALAPITALIGLDPDNGLLLQKRVEYAFRSGRPEPQVEAYLDLGRHLARHGRSEKAAAVIGRVLELDPHNVEARAAAQQIAPAPAAPPPPPQQEYVDLGSLVLDAMPEGEASTRFVVEEKEPSGDEDRDFAEMLTHFRQKVAENIDVEDSASHYDLGVAFMEMGLVDEAIAQFQVALRGGANPLATLELLGQCFFEKGQHAVGSRVLDRALRLAGVADADLVGVLYLLGRIEEDAGAPARALEYYERVVAVDIRFRDTAGRIERLRAGVFDSPGRGG